MKEKHHRWSQVSGGINICQDCGLIRFTSYKSMGVDKVFKTYLYVSDERFYLKAPPCPNTGSTGNPITNTEVNMLLMYSSFKFDELKNYQKNILQLLKQAYKF